MIVTIHQPEHLPWLGFFDKARQADLLVLLDHVQFRKNYFQNRNRIRTSQGESWVTVPVLTKGHAQQSLNQVRIDNAGSPRWRDKTYASIAQSYGKAPFWREHEAFFRATFSSEWEYLAELNEHFIRYLLGFLSPAVQVIRSSTLPVDGEKSELILDICRHLGASLYLSGVSGRDYLDLPAFAAAGMKVEFQVYHHPIYRQMHEPFFPCMSTIDLLFNHGPRSRDILQGIGVQTINEVFT